MKYRKKPIPVEAIKMGKEGFEETPEWFIKALSTSKVYYRNYFGSNFIKCGFRVQTLEGNMDGNIGDYLVRGVKGELYPCRGGIFEMIYEKVEE